MFKNFPQVCKNALRLRTNKMCASHDCFVKTKFLVCLNLEIIYIRMATAAASLTSSKKFYIEENHKTFFTNFSCAPLYISFYVHIHINIYFYTLKKIRTRKKPLNENENSAFSFLLCTFSYFPKARSGVL